jgi:putative RNA 2'-phosphotransferase
VSNPFKSVSPITTQPTRQISIIQFPNPMSDIKHTSKFLSLVLRHKPETIGIVLDENGWVDVAELMEKMNAKNSQENLTFERLQRVVAENDKQRFIFNADKTRIRANQGHTVDIELGLDPKTPPAVLYHGTAISNIESIKKTGINKGKRQHVHLSKDTETATKVGTRHGKPIILSINTEKMHQDGIVFFCSENGVWLTDFVAVEYIVFGD